MADQDSEEKKTKNKRSAKKAHTKAKPAKKSNASKANTKQSKAAKPAKATKAAQANKPAKPTKSPKTIEPVKPVVPKRPKESEQVVQKRSLKDRLLGIASGRRFAIGYLIFAVLVLLVSTVFWSILGALIHRGNADQLSDNYLFESAKTFHGATFPDAHTFLLKWPVFVLMKAVGLTDTSFAVATVALAVVTVAAFAWLLSRIERRPLMLGTIFLALASVLMLVPAQPYPGGLLPVNLAMVTTRNIEYIVYLISLVLVVRATKWRSWNLVWAGLLLGILGASDKLFVDMSLGGAVIMALVYLVWRKRPLVQVALRWLAVSVFAFALATAIVLAIKASGLTHVSSQSGAGPFSLVHDSKSVALGIVYAGFGLLTDFGANPAATISILRKVPHEALQGMSSAGALTYVINGLLLLGALYVAARLVWASFKRTPKPKAKDAKSTNDPVQSRAERLSLMLLATTLTSFVMFVISDHYYPVDARYLTISVFALFVCGATVTRNRQWRKKWIMLAGLLLLAGVACGMVPAWRTYQAEKSAMATVNLRDTQIVQILGQHHVDTLVGDYWRVLPTRMDSDSKLHVMPMAGCASPLTILSSKSWQPDLKTKRFAYLLTLDGSLTNYPKCSLQQIITTYGRPDSSTLVAGTVAQPQEMILFYEKGTQGASHAVSSQSKSTILPIGIGDLVHRTCDKQTVINVVAHEDDDLLFMNPDTLHALQAGNCVRSIYVTAGDAGSDNFYWLGREKGAEAAYASMMGIDNVWTQRVVRLPGGQYITVVNPRHNGQLSLIFMRLPDGNLNGQGFASTHYQSLARLKLGVVDQVSTVDEQSKYTASELITALLTLIESYGPAEIHTQSSMSSMSMRDHSDHRNVSYFVTQAYSQFDQSKGAYTLAYYRGYPIRNMPENVFGEDFLAKQKAFLMYSQFDDGVCHNEDQCADSTNNYSYYLRREYQTTQ